MASHDVSEGGTRRWYVAQTHARAEDLAAANLRRQGFGVYLPRFARKVRHARREHTIASALFPSYLFISLDVAVDRWRAVLSTIGVSRLVCQGDRPAAVAEAVVAEIRAREDETGLIALARRPDFVPGQGLRITGGALKDLEALFIAEDGDERVIVLLSLLGRPVEARLSSGLVAALA